MNSLIRSLNERLKNELGANRLGEPVYRWMFATELLFPVFGEVKHWERTAANLYVPSMAQRPIVNHRQCNRDVWLVAGWEDMTPEQWQAATGGMAPYPERGGMYFMTDFDPMPEGHLPSDRVTDVLIRRVKAKRERLKTEKDAYRAITERYQEAEAAAESQRADLLGEYAMHNPNVSLCGIDVPR